MSASGWRGWLFAGATGLCLGLAGGIKYQAVMGGLFALIPWVSLWRSGRLRDAIVSGVAVVVGGGIGLLVTTPTLWMHPAYFVEMLPKFLGWQSGLVDVEVGPLKKIQNNLFEFFRWMGPHGTCC